MGFRLCLMLVLITGCGGDDDPNEPVACMPGEWSLNGNEWPGVCGRVCQERPADETTFQCGSRTCDAGVTVDGVSGCCVANVFAEPPIVEWQACE